MIYVLAPDTNIPSGGIKQLYRHVDILNQNGLDACIVHEMPGFRCTWFNNKTKVLYAHGLVPRLDDFVVVPEIYGPHIADIARGTKKVIFNQGVYNTFVGYSLDRNELVNPYTDQEIAAAIVVSEDSKQYLNYVFPQLDVKRIRNGIDSSLFHYSSGKKRQIAFMMGKHPEDIEQVINILKFKGLLRDYELILIQDMSPTQVAAVLKESLIFLSFGYPEGFSLPPAEAMSCGCIVVGYHGFGGKEYFNREYCYPVEHGNIISFVENIKEVIETNETNPVDLQAKGKQASSFITTQYSLQNEEQDLINVWKDLVNNSRNY